MAQYYRQSENNYAGLGSRVASRSQTPSVFFAKPPLSRHLSFGY